MSGKQECDAQSVPASDPAESLPADPERRAMLRKLGRFAAVTPPAVTLLLSASMRPTKALAASVPVSSRQLKVPDGTVDGQAALATVAGFGDGAAVGSIGGIGLCFAAIKALEERVDALEACARG
jgi:hypothetical protein